MAEDIENKIRRETADRLLREADKWERTFGGGYHAADCRRGAYALQEAADLSEAQRALLEQTGEVGRLQAELRKEQRDHQKSLAIMEAACDRADALQESIKPIAEYVAERGYTTYINDNHANDVRLVMRDLVATTNNYVGMREERKSLGERIAQAIEALDDGMKHAAEIAREVGRG